jgi:hypothetical protein
MWRSRRLPAYTDRTWGGSATSCSGGVDLKDVTLDKTRGVLYRGHRAVRSRQIGKGSFGTVTLLTFPRTDEAVMPAIMVKKQVATHEALANLKVAESLRDCRLVDFTSVMEDKRRIWTFMEHMGGDCRKMPLARRKQHAAAFAQFLEDTLNCLLGSGASFGDMKLANCAFRECASGPEFRLIDVDGVNSDYATFPAYPEWQDDCTDPADRAAETRYAFAVTAMLFERDNDAYKPFYWRRMASPMMRRALLLAHADRTPTPKIRSLIMDHAIPVLGMHDPPPEPVEPPEPLELVESVPATEFYTPMSVDPTAIGTPAVRYYTYEKWMGSSTPHVKEPLTEVDEYLGLLVDNAELLYTIKKDSTVTLEVPMVYDGTVWQQVVDKEKTRSLLGSPWGMQTTLAQARTYLRSQPPGHAFTLYLSLGVVIVLTGRV